MRRFWLGLLVFGIAATLGAGQALAAIDPNGSFGFIGIGNITVDTGDITNATASKTLPATEIVNTVSPTFNSSPNNLGIVAGAPVTLGYLVLPIPHPLNTLTPIAPLTVMVPSAGTAGTLTFTFTDTITKSLTSTGATTAGGFVVGYAGTLTGDTSGTFNLGIAATLSESCSQSQTGAVINCSETIAVPSSLTVPEPGSLLLLGSGLLAAAIAGRRMRVKKG